MGIYDIKAEKEEELNEAQSRAFDIYNQQIKALAAIIETDWYKEIKAYFERDAESAKDQLTTADSVNILSLQERYRLANNFVTFLNNFETKIKKK